LATCPRLDLSTFELALIEPTPRSIAAHEAVLKDLDKASGGKTVWRSGGGMKAVA
jgi:DNA polymerase-3 subunit epsilon